MKSLLEKSKGGGSNGAFLTETNTIKIKEKPEIKIEKSPKKPLPILKEEKIIEPIKIKKIYETKNHKVK